MSAVTRSGVRPDPPDAGAGSVPTPDQLDELTLLVRAQEGDVAAFEALARRHAAVLHRRAARLLSDPAEAADVLPESLLDAWRRLGSVRGDVAFATWMDRIVTDRCLAVLRERRRHRADGPEVDPPPEVVDPPAEVVDRAMRAVRADLRPADDLALASPHGPARLGRPAAAAVLRHVVDRVSGVRARSCRIEQPDGGPGVAVIVTVTARFGVELATVTARARQLVVAAGGQALGLPVRRVDITVVDVSEEGW